MAWLLKRLQEWFVWPAARSETTDDLVVSHFGMFTFCAGPGVTGARPEDSRPARSEPPPTFVGS
jgi:hypothetical protein